MSIEQTITVRCDECTRGAQFETPHRRAARWNAKQMGWTFSGGSDYCPQCSQVRDLEKDLDKL